jgi:hypothetical protein
MFNDIAWNKTAVTITSNIAIAPNGTLTADKIIATAVNTNHILSTSPSTFTTSTSYTFSYYAKSSEYTKTGIRIGGAGYSTVNLAAINLVNGTIISQQGFTSLSVTNENNGWYRIAGSFVAAVGLTPNIHPLSDSYTIVADNFSYLGDGTSGILAWGAQLVEGSSALEYFTTTDRQDVPRIDYSLGGCPNILLEPQRSNLTLWSEQFDNAWWGKTNLSITANTTTSPSGVVNADTLDEGSASSAHRLLGSAVSITLGSNNSFSLYVKKDTMRYFRIAINDINDTGRWIAAQFDLDNQTFTTGAGSTVGSVVSSASIQSVGNGWFRVNVVGSLAVTTSVFPVVFSSDGTAINPIDTRGGNSYLGTNKTLFIWGAQLEAGAYATSYIPTTSASVTRNADIISRNNIFTNGLITASGGTWFVDLRNVRALSRDGISNGILLGSVATNGLSIRNGSGTSFPAIFKYISGGATQILGTISAGTSKLAFKWNGSTADVFLNGIKVVSATAFTPTNMDSISAAIGDVPANINSMMLFPTPLSDSDLQLLTGDSFDSYAAMAAYFNYTLQ